MRPLAPLPANPTLAIVTPSYLPDLARCALLVESLERVQCPFRHYLIIDRCDKAAFAHLASERTVVLESEQLLGRWLWRLPGRKALWVSLRAPPVRGWIIQQILKMAIVNQVTDDILVYCDSDMTFLRSFALDDLTIDGRLGLLDAELVNESLQTWTGVASQLLGLDPASVPTRNHVGNLICWRRDVLLALQERIAAVSGTSWQVAVARRLRFSEYVLYGTFVRQVLGYHGAGQAPSTRPLVKPSWGLDLSSDAALADFFSKLEPETVAVMVHSKDGIDADRIRAVLGWQTWPAGEAASAMT